MKLEQLFQDIDGTLSSKRVIAISLVSLFISCYVALFFGFVDPALGTQAQGLIEKLSDLIKWVIGFIASEQAVKFAKGNNNVETPTR